MSGLWLVSYDICADKSRRKVYEILKDYGTRVQYSVFECHLDARTLGELRARLLAEIDDGDSLRWYPLCVWCRETVFFQGVGQPPDDPEYFLQ